MKELPNMRNLMTELDNNVFIKNWHVRETAGFCIEYIVFYVDYSKRAATFTKESTKEQIKSQLLYLINRDLKEKGWVKEELEIKDKYNPAVDPYYKQEWLYVNKEIN